MTVLSAQTIRARCRQTNLVKPFFERTRALGMTFGLSAAGYDVRIKQDFALWPSEFALASTVEHFNMPNDLLAYVKDKSTWARRGLSIKNTVIEPGWRGFLTLELHNTGKSMLRLEGGMPIAQIIFHLLDEPTEHPYEGKYQNQADQPVTAIYDEHGPSAPGWRGEI